MPRPTQWCVHHHRPAREAAVSPRRVRWPPGPSAGTPELSSETTSWLHPSLAWQQTAGAYTQTPMPSHSSLGTTEPASTEQCTHLGLDSRQRGGGGNVTGIAAQEANACLEQRRRQVVGCGREGGVVRREHVSSSEAVSRAWSCGLASATEGGNGRVAQGCSPEAGWPGLLCSWTRSVPYSRRPSVIAQQGHMRELEPGCDQPSAQQSHLPQAPARTGPAAQVPWWSGR